VKFDWETQELLRQQWLAVEREFGQAEQGLTLTGRLAVESDQTQQELQT
jgi:hypothetical protein